MLAQGATNDWPAAVEVLNEHGRSPFVLICEHASNHIPTEYNKLGLDDQELTRHIAWDIGRPMSHVLYRSASTHRHSSVAIPDC